MPFVRILWKPALTPEDTVTAIRDAAGPIVAAALAEWDPDHNVEDTMVDVRVETVGPLDRIHPDLMVSVFARQEPARSRNRDSLAAAMAAGFERVGVPGQTMIELLLTERACTYEYQR